MDIKPLAVCLAACAALLAVCHGCSTGKEFITTFIPNYQRTAEKNHRLHVVLTSQGLAANVRIQVDSVKFSKQLTLAAGESRWVSLPCESELEKLFVTEKSAVRISASSPISVISFNRRKYTGDGGVVYPIQELGTEYYVYTPSGGHSSMDKLVAIVNGNGQNQITLLPRADVTLRGGTKWKRGKAVTVNLAPFASYLVRSHLDLSGMQIRSQQPVAVLTGHQCLDLGAKCEHVYEQLPAMPRLGKEYLVPRVNNFKATNWALVVAVEDNTVVTTLTGQSQKKETLKKAGDMLTKTVKQEPMIVRGDKKFMTLLLSSNKPHDPYLMTLTPTSKTSTDWAVETLEGYHNTIAIMSEKEGAGSVKVCVNKVCSKPSWKTIVADQRWVWAIVQIGKKQSHVTVEGDVRMAVYASGGQLRHGYGLAGVCSEVAAPYTTTLDPCATVKCRAKTRCVKGKCVPVSTATCHALGDPHYKTFDGRPYDFQGTCTYILTNVVKLAPDLVPFSVLATNNHRGNNRVSFVRTVFVKVYQYTIVLDRHRGKVQVDGELQYLPVTLLDGKISIKMIGHNAYLTTDFGLKVKYDFNMMLYITVPSSYFGHLGGLCGNYNGDRSDDLPEPRGASRSAVLKMTKNWKLNKSDLSCDVDCGNRCPTCDEKQKAHYRRPNLCGILTKPDGPFSACHKKVDPSLFLDNCLYDTCINKGARKFLCDNIKSYDDACREEGVKINPQWRMEANCPLTCPAGSHYEACGTACPATCGSTDRKLCIAVCVEGCQCDKGRVLSGDKCVKIDKCGCQHEGRYYPADTKFWGDKTCTSRCICHKGKAKCKAVKCGKNQQCAVKQGVRGCYATSYATCYGSGDPHYRSFDNRRFDFQGDCIYTLSEYTKDTDEELEKFKVLVQNDRRGRNKAVSFTKSVSLTVFGVTISMSRVSRGRILVNSRSVNLPFSTEDGKLSMYRCGSYGIVKTYFGLTLKFNWNSYVSLTLPSSYASSTGGLCGNYNGRRDDDLMKPDGTQATSLSAFGHSWKVGGDAACTSECPNGKCPACEPAMVVRYQAKRYCGIIADKSGPFGKCHSKLDHKAALTDCVFDLCQFKGHASALCNSLSDLTTSCQEAGATVKNWRTGEFCPLACGANSHYELCAPPCPLTCSGLAPPEGCDESARCTEGCVCDNGFVLSDDKCVPVAECGCQYEGQYYQTGQVFFTGESCNSRCQCTEGGNVKCDPKFSCSVNEKCVVKDGVSFCAPKSVGSCSVSGVRNVRSFDGQTFPLWGNCLFTLAEVKQKKGGMDTFSVNVLQKTNKKGVVSRSVQLRVCDLDIIMETGVQWRIKVDHVTVSLPVSLCGGKVRVHQNGNNILTETDSDLKLSYNSVAGIFLQIPSTYRNLTRGLCGNYDGDVSLEKVAAKNPTGTAAVWVVKNEDVQCDTSCGAASCPGPDEQSIPKAKSECDIIQERQGPFAGCHATVNPTPDYDSCVRELSIGKGAADILCRHIQNYVTACQLAGAKIKKWRSDRFCPLQCPTGSHYELCSSSCDSTCFSLERSEACPVCQEGCQCDDGLMSDGVRCVPVEKCGCVVEGQYYSSGSSVLRNDCSERCSCQAGQFSCKPASCKDGEECRNKDGVVGCLPTDPCAEVECREKEHCEVSEGKGECVPDSKALCWAFGDPHYQTLDGYHFSFQGTCSYVLVNTTGRDPTLPEITVITKNELRGNSEGSFVRSSIVKLLGHTISIPSKDRGIVLVDGIRTELPVNLEQGGISITQTNIQGKIQTEIGIEITFDWSTLMMVSLSSSYYNNVGGLCGNFNGNKEDELTTPSGTKGTNVTDWAGTWSYEDNDPFCYHFCDGLCPQCSQEDRKKYTGPNYCGILSDKNGPFSRCHAKVPVADFLSDCLYDVCINEGRQQVLCEALSSYLVECHEAGASVAPWRHLISCDVACPGNSTYKVCGPACPLTCAPMPEVCPKICVEGCFCDPGFVQSGQECVIRKTGCGCNHDGRYYHPGETFWADSQCQEKCTCDGATQKAKCERAGCRTGEKCDVVNGVQDCYPISFKACTARGDPHFNSFDGHKFDFQGDCVYRMAGLCGDAKGLTPFEVHLENNRRGRKGVSYAKVVTVKVFGNTYTLTREIPGQVQVDGLETPLPYSNSSNKSLIQVYRRHRLAVLETNFLKVSFDFGSSVRVELATSYHNAVCGLCGNLNDDPADDLMLPDGKLASSANEFGVSQWVADTEGCSKDCKDCAQPLPPDFTPPSYTSVCDIITEKEGPLGDCVDRLQSKQYHSDCVYDMVINNGSQEAACNIITNYVEDCHMKGGCVRSWRTRRFCWMHCQGHSMYSVTASGCPLTCSSPSPPIECKVPPSEGCVCHPGYLESEDGCVPFAQCGCRYKGQYVASGQSFYDDGVCKRLCTCNGGVLSCKIKPCSRGKSCRVKDGKRGCY